MTEPVLDDDQLHDLLERETLLMELVETPGWQALRDEVALSLEFQRRRLLAGEIESHEEYLKLSARLQGAEFVLDTPRDFSARVKVYRQQLAELSEGQEE